MFRSFGILLVVTIAPFSSNALAADGHTPDGDGQLTKADIPSNLPPEVRRLIEQTFSEKVQDRALAAGKLGQMHERAAPAIPFLLRLLHDHRLSGPYVDDALLSIGEPALEACIADAKEVAARPPPASGHWDDRAIETLGKFKYHFPQAVDALLELLKSADSQIRRSAVIFLNGTTDTRATLPLLDTVVNSWNADMRFFAVDCLKRLRDPRCVDPLLEIVKKRGPWQELSYPDLTDCAIIALGCQHDRRAVPTLLEILKSPKESESNRHCAAYSVAQINDPATFQYLVGVLLDRNAPLSIRTGAARGFGLSSTRPAEKSPDGSHDDARILALLTSVLNSEQEAAELRTAAARAMGDFGRLEAVATLCAAAKSQSQDELRFWSAASAVKLTNGAIGDAEVVRVIQDYHPPIGDRGFEARQAQREALETLAGKEGSQENLSRDGFCIVSAVGLGLLVIAIASMIRWFYLRRAKVTSA